MLSQGDVLSHAEMCNAEGRGGLQHGMWFRTRGTHSIILMSQRKGAPYPDKLSADGKILHYIGEDVRGAPDKRFIDQILATPNGTLTENGKFFTAALNSKVTGHAELVRVYEKLVSNVWVYNGLFRLTHAWMANDGTRNVCVFELQLVEAEEDGTEEEPELRLEAEQVSLSPGRLIPSDVKLAVYKRDKGMCVECLKHGREVKHDLHFDHILPWSKGGSSTSVENIQLLCQRHNLEKSARIL